MDADETMLYAFVAITAIVAWAALNGQELQSRRLSIAGFFSLPLMLGVLLGVVRTGLCLLTSKP
jgi:hypothetical protein